MRLFLIFLLLSLVAHADPISVTYDESSGTYRLALPLQHWTLSGTTGSPWTNVTTRIDGDWRELQFEASDGVTRTISISLTQPVVRFEGPDVFPNFTRFPQHLHEFSFQDQQFAPCRFGLVETSTPWMLFDDACNTIVLSPASDFIVARMCGDGQTSIGSGLNPGVSASHRTILVCGRGIGTTFDAWGQALTTWLGRHRPSNQADTLLKYFGYWTDAGAAYWYDYDLSKGYAGTLLDLRKRVYEKAPSLARSQPTQHQPGHSQIEYGFLSFR